jgi:hypothetical protein
LRGRGRDQDGHQDRDKGDGGNARRAGALAPSTMPAIRNLATSGNLIFCRERMPAIAEEEEASISNSM